uniref:Uncharacterized protein n=1 Tax=Arion vulgaris TaxID=1028688 RepID=A0A0B6Z2E8_9EUPU
MKIPALSHLQSSFGKDYRFPCNLESEYSFSVGRTRESTILGIETLYVADWLVAIERTSQYSGWALSHRY